MRLCCDWRIVPIISALLAVGCGEPHQTAEVDGVLVIGGKPGHKVRVQFIPDVDKGCNGPISIGETDGEGKFVLHYRVGNESMPRPGAVVGWHRIVLADLQLAESATGKGVPVRMAAGYSLPGSTPLVCEIKEGKQLIELEVP